MQAIIVYIGRDNEELFQLLQDDALVSAGAVTRAVLKFGTYCIDTDVVDDADIISFDDDHQVLSLKLGLIDDLEAETYADGILTIFDSSSENGYAWETFRILAEEWSICD